LDNNVAPFAESMFVRMANSEIQRLISVRTVGNQALNFAILVFSICFRYFPSLRMENINI